MNNRLTERERKYLAQVKALACSICDAPGPSAAHHIRQHNQWLCVALCDSCHQSAIMGWHGQRRAWSVRKMDELDALAITIRRIEEQRQ